MRRHLVLAAALAAVASACAAAAEPASWAFRRSYYSHDPATGNRVAQYAPEKAAYVRTDPTYQQSVYRHTRTGIQVGDSFDYLHMVETWGEGERIRPYGEWLYPYRAGATPYGPWGNPAGPWTTPFGSWVNPYGIGRLPMYQVYPVPPLPYIPPAATLPATPTTPSAPSAGEAATNGD